MKKILLTTMVLCLAFSLHAANKAPRTLFRNVVMEEWTGTWCGWCVRGIEGMKKAKELYGDRFVGIAIHDGDIMGGIFNDYYPLNLPGYPTCAIDRDGKSYDPYYSGLNAISRYMNEEPDLEVSVTGTWNENHTQVNIMSETEFWGSGSGYRVAYVLVADGLTGQSSYWTQKNFYSGQMDKLTGDPAIDAYVYMNGTLPGTVFNDVAIASSYVGGKNQAEPFTGPFGDGVMESNTYTLNLPKTPAELVNAIQKDQVYVVAIVTNADGTIANAAKAKVQDQPLPPPDEYVVGDISGDGEVDVSDYIGVANCILGNAPEGFNEKAADVNNDGIIDVSDYIGVANIILYGNVYGQ